MKISLMQYTKANLETLLHHQVQKPMSSLDDLGKYVREFHCIIALINKKKKLTEDVINKKFLKGFPPRFCNMLATRLHLKDLDHDVDNPWPFDKVYKQATYLQWLKQLSQSLFPKSYSQPSAPPTILKPNLKINSFAALSIPAASSVAVPTATGLLSANCAKIFMKDGSDIPRSAAGRNFKEKIDNFLALRESIMALANLVSIQSPGAALSSRG
ncbi:hypothetical protein BKA83DRAFT_4497653 [Pisolithus microcarpus]|nr:hypothetical protein BKA83DRAFT_4497653 [Pisolithus microcarpus]